MKNIISSVPNAAKFTSAMVSLPVDNTVALCDIIDNSIDAGAKNVSLFISKRNGVFKVRVADDGYGMDKRTIGEALKFGSDTYKDETQLGRFGMGLSTAMHHLCKKATIISKVKDVNAGIWDKEHIDKTNKLECFVGAADINEKNEFHQYIKAETGTLIIFEKCSGIKNKDVESFCKNLKNEISRKFRDKIDDGVNIYVNRESCESVDPLHLNNPDIEIEEESLIPVQLVVNGKNIDTTITLKAVSLPKGLKSSNIDDKINNLNSDFQGFYVMRNGREIATASTLGIYSKNDQLNRFRAQLEFGAQLDDAMGLNIVKNGLDIHDDLKEILRSYLLPLIEKLKNKYSARDEDGNREYDYSDFIKLIQNCSNDLNFFTNSQNNGIKNIKNINKNDDIPQREYKEREKNNENNKNNKRNPSLNIEIKNASIDSNNRYIYTKQNNSIIITFNVNHEFYKILIESKNKKEAANAVFEAFSEISAQLKYIEEQGHEYQQNIVIEAFNAMNLIKSNNMTILLSANK